MEANKEHVVAREEIPQIRVPTGRVEDVFDNDVIASIRKARDGSVKAVEERRACGTPIRVAGRSQAPLSRRRSMERCRKR